MRRALAVAVLALWALVGLPGTAQAGGPTSVLITEPASGESAALYYTSAEYADLERLLSAVPKSPTAQDPVGAGAADYNVTWMIHDVQPWRLDAVHVTGDGTAYVATTFVSDPSDTARQGAWHEVAQPAALAALLDRVFSGTPANAAAEPVLDPEPTVAPTPPAPETRWFSLAGWRWAVPGVLGGVLVALVATRRRVPGEPRRALVDVPPERAGLRSS